VAKPGTEISLLFDLFVAANRVRRLIEAALAEAPLRGDEYAVYSLLFEAGPLTATEMGRALGMPLTTVLDHLRAMESRRHLRRAPHPRDGRAQHVSLTIAGVTVHRRTNAAWEPMRKQLEESLSLPIGEVRRALGALGMAARAGLERYEGRLAV
jgi:DNA-binding MarR family transcriptional regulator